MSQDYNGSSTINQQDASHPYRSQAIYRSHVTQPKQQQTHNQYHVTSVNQSNPKVGYALPVRIETSCHDIAYKTPPTANHVTFTSSQSGTNTSNNNKLQSSIENDNMEGDESQSLLCCETFSSPTPPSDDSGWTPPGSSIVWSQSNNLVNKVIATKNYNSVNNGVSQSELPVPCYLVINKNNSNSQHYILGQSDRNQDNFSQSNSQDFNLRPKDHLLKAALLGGTVNINNNKPESQAVVALEKDINSNFQSKCSEHNSNFVRNDVDCGRRMSGSNGYDRNRMTGSSGGGSKDNLSRLSDGSSASGQLTPQTTSTEGMLMGRVGSTGGIHDAGGTRSIVAGTVGAGPQVTIGGLFRPPQSVSDTRYAAGQYTSSVGSTVGPFSPSLYSSHTHGAAPYSAFYSGQYQGYTNQMHGTLDPQFGSYSAVLQSMGTQAAQSQVPRSPYGSVTGGVAHYPLLSVTQASATPGGNKTFVHNSASSLHESRDEMKFRREQELQEIQRRHSTGVIKEEKQHHFSVPSGYSEPSRASVSSTLRESPIQKRDLGPGGVHDFYKAPAGGRGQSLKHRILGPPDSTNSLTVGNPQHSAFINTDEPVPKRTKMSATELEREPAKSGFLDRSEAGPSGSQSGGGNGKSAPLHYPEHFVKGSIIQLANGALKRVEDLQTDDFVNSADISNDLKIDSSTVVRIEENKPQGTAVLGFVVGLHKVEVTVEATVEHPFFVFGQGWSSCEPMRTSKRFGLNCHQLSVGDMCISLTHKEVTAHAAEISQQQKYKHDGQFVFSKDLKSESSPRGSPRQRNKSPAQASSSYGQSFRSESAQNDSNSCVKEEHAFVTPTTSQISTSHSQEQKSQSTSVS